jgi:hypothetical protein
VAPAQVDPVLLDAPVLVALEPGVPAVRAVPAAHQAQVLVQAAVTTAVVQAAPQVAAATTAVVQAARQAVAAAVSVPAQAVAAPVAVAVGLVPQVPSVARAVVPSAARRARSSGVRSSTTCRRPRWVACRFPAEAERSYGCLVAPH